MNYALISDVHANLPALEAVLAEIEARPDVDGIYHLGDLVGYAPWPDEVVAAIRSRGIAGVAGNYDSTTASGYAHCGCRYEEPRQEELSHLSYQWTLEHTAPETKRWLAALPFRIDLRPLGGHTSGPRLLLVHGNPVLNTVYWTEDRSDDFCRKMADVLRAKDGDPRAGYAIVGIEYGDVRVGFVRVEYDLERAVTAIRASGLPDDFADYLESGGMEEPLAADAG